MRDLSTNGETEYLTPEQTSGTAPSYAEFPFLIENDFDQLVADAADLRSRKKEVEASIKDLDLEIMSLMAALPSKSVTVADTLVTFVDTTEAKTLDKKTLKQNLVRYGVPVDEVNRMFEASMKTSQRSASIRIMLPKGHAAEQGEE